MTFPISVTIVDKSRDAFSTVKDCYGSLRAGAYDVD